MGFLGYLRVKIVKSFIKSFTNVPHSLYIFEYLNIIHCKLNYLKDHVSNIKPVTLIFFRMNGINRKREFCN